MVSKLLISAERASNPQLGYFLLILANKFKVEAIPKVLALAEHQLSAIVEGRELSGPGGESQSASPEARVALAKDIYGVLAGALRRYAGSSLRPIFSTLLQGPANPDYGHILARDFDIIFRPHPCLTKDLNATVKPLWSQKAYINLVKPMLPLAWPQRQDAPAPELSRANYGVAVLSAVRHLPHGVYADDAADLIRLVLCALRSLPAGPDAEAALRVLETLARESAAALVPFLNSVVDACAGLIGGVAPDVSWMPEGYAPPADKGNKARARCRNLAIVLLGYLPAGFEHGKLRSAGPRVRRLLAVACGDGVRGVRKAALAAKVAWEAVN